MPVERLVRRLVPGGESGWAAAGVDEFLRSYSTPRGRLAFNAVLRNIYLDEPHGEAGLWSRLGAIQHESLFIWGRKDRLVPIAFMRARRARVPGRTARRARLRARAAGRAPERDARRDPCVPRGRLSQSSGGGVEDATSGAGSGSPPLSSMMPSVSQLDHEHDLPHGQREELVALGRPARVEPADLDVGEREEVALVRVQEVRRPGPVALVGELDGPLDVMALGLDPDALAAEVHGVQYRPSVPGAV